MPRLKNNPLKLVIFDLDGTLVDAYQAVAASLNYALGQVGLAPVDDNVIKRTVGWGDHHLVGAFVPERDLDRALSIYRQHHSRALKKGTSFLPGAKALIEKLRAGGYALAVASNRPTRFTNIILRHLGIKDRFDYVLCGDKVPCPKPAADILELILKKFSVGRDEALYVGDMTVDVQTGEQAGVRTVAVLTGSCTREEIAVLKPLRIIERIGDLPGVIREIYG